MKRKGSPKPRLFPSFKAPVKFLGFEIGSKKATKSGKESVTIEKELSSEEKERKRKGPKIGARIGTPSYCF